MSVESECCNSGKLDIREIGLGIEKQLLNGKYAGCMFKKKNFSIIA